MKNTIPNVELVIRPLVLYGAAVIATGAATLIQINLASLVGVVDPFITYFVATLFVAWYSGFPAAIITVVLSALAGLHFFVIPAALASFFGGGSGAGLTVVGFVVSGVGASFLLDRQREISEQVAIEAARRRSAENAERDERRRLEATLASMADGVICSDSDGRIVFANQVALRLLRARKAQVLGKHIDDVFRLADELTHAKVDSPVASVLGDGRVAGLPDHTVLIAQDRAEIPIDDSCAPIRGEDGTIQGVVLVFRDITERKRAEVALHDANADLVRANRDLERFAFVASHDLQEPLRMITANAQLLIKSCSAETACEVRAFVENIFDGTRCMRELLRDLLAYVELDSNPGVSMEEVNLNLVVADVLATLKEPIEKTGASVTCEPLPIVRANAAHFTSVFQNLIGNALKYKSERSPRIHISVHTTDGELRFAVADNGIGIDPRYQHQIFNVFKRLHGKDIPGTGVGLAICKRVVESYGGRIWVESRAGEGATFYLGLPDISLRRLS